MTAPKLPIPYQHEERGKKIKLTLHISTILFASIGIPLIWVIIGRFSKDSMEGSGLGLAFSGEILGCVLHLLLS
jgi:hypothetical protein